MKKILSSFLTVTLALGMIMSLAACKESEAADSQVQDSSAETTTYGADVSATEKTASTDKAKTEKNKRQTTPSSSLQDGTGTSKTTAAKSKTDVDGEPVIAAEHQNNDQNNDGTQPKAATKAPTVTAKPAAATEKPKTTTAKPAAVTAKTTTATAKPAATAAKQPEPTAAPQPEATDPPSEGHQKGGNHTHSITYNGNGNTGGGGRAPDSVWCEDDFLIPTETGGIFTRDGYVFTGWNTKPAGNGSSYAPGSKIYEVDDDIVLYAQWSPL